MKKLFVLMMCLCAATTAVKADNDRPIQVNALPVAAKEFIKAHFPEVKVSYAKMEKDMLDKTYDVVFVNGDKVEFMKDGAWKEVNCKSGAVPAGIVPTPIVEHVAQNHAGQAIVKIDRDKRDYEIKLSSGLELKYDLKFNLIGYDD